MLYIVERLYIYLYIILFYTSYTLKCKLAEITRKQKKILKEKLSFMFGRSNHGSWNQGVKTLAVALTKIFFIVVKDGKDNL